MKPQKIGLAWLHIYVRSNQENPVKALFISFVVLFGFGSRAEIATVQVEGNALVIDGAIEDGLFEKVRSQYTSNIDKIIIRSTGGSASEGLAIGEFIRDKKLIVEVNEYCYSSCANYIFLGAAKKVLKDQESIVCYHGNLTTSFSDKGALDKKLREALAPKKLEKKQEDQYVSQIVQSIAQNVERENRFFSSIHIDSIELFNMANYPGYKWVCPTKTGFQRFGVENIEGEVDFGRIAADEFLDGGLNAVEMSNCLGDLKDLLGTRRCKDKNAYMKCLNKNKMFISRQCFEALHFSGDNVNVHHRVKEPIGHEDRGIR